ncbi:hypothetical protein BKA66DRAFT_502655 [Pyrenochaeta sp. MPI-SDFR-AT-0127]|nr:hypothetical protein BKA66DRAFT_502655 [Pyrenochaeta sp. MPI-SDFR-AT-0127]
MTISNVWSRKRLLPIDLLLSALLYSSTASAELFYTASSPVVQDGFINKSPSICPVAQDGYTSNNFPWTHNPICADAVLPNPDGEGLGIQKTFCTYSNAEFNNGRGISFVVSPEVAATITSETFGQSVGGLDGQLGEELGMWEVKKTSEKGKGLFAKKNIAAIFPGESLIVKTPVLFIAKELLAASPTTETSSVLNAAIKQLPKKTRETVLSLDRTRGKEVEGLILTNGITVKWPWADEVPELLAVTPEVARINHACRPNALWRFNDYTLAFDVFALRDIKPGEEITISYGFGMRGRKRRMLSIEVNLGFACRCPLCTADDAGIEQSNDNLSEIKALKSVLPTDPKENAELLRLLPSLIKVLLEEELHAEVPQYEEILAYTFSSFGVEERAKYWAGRARKHWAVIAGKDSWEQRRCGDLEDDVKGHATWNTWDGEPWQGVFAGQS